MKKLWYHCEKDIVYKFDGCHLSFLLENWKEMELKKSPIRNKIAYDAGWARIHIEKGAAGIEAKNIETIHKAALWLNKKYGILKLYFDDADNLELRSVKALVEKDLSRFLKTGRIERINP